MSGIGTERAEEHPCLDHRAVIGEMGTSFDPVLHRSRLGRLLPGLDVVEDRLADPGARIHRRASVGMDGDPVSGPVGEPVDGGSLWPPAVSMS